MKKETIVAIFLGIATGVIIALFLVIQSQNSKTNANKDPNALISPTVKVPTEEILTFAVSEPQNKSVASKNSTTIKGKAPKGSLIVINSATDEKVTKIDSDTFSIDFPLSLGENIMKITAYTNGDAEEKTLIVYYIKNE